jgi:hypothetical protein
MAGVWGLGAQRFVPLRTHALWWFTALAEVAIFVEVVLGVVLVAGQDIEAPRFHTFYGFIAVIAIGIAYSYRQSEWVREHIYAFYGGVGLFLMGLGIRAMVLG